MMVALLVKILPADRDTMDSIEEFL